MVTMASVYLTTVLIRAGHLPIRQSLASYSSPNSHSQCTFVTSSSWVKICQPRFPSVLRTRCRAWWTLYRSAYQMTDPKLYREAMRRTSMHLYNKAQSLYQISNNRSPRDQIVNYCLRLQLNRRALRLNIIFSHNPLDISRAVSLLNRLVFNRILKLQDSPVLDRRCHRCPTATASCHRGPALRCSLSMHSRPGVRGNGA